MTDIDQAAHDPLLRVASPGSPATHIAEADHFFTLCGRMAVCRLRLMRAKPVCRRCVIEATSRGWALP